MKDNLDGIKYIVDFINRKPQFFEIIQVKTIRKNGNTSHIISKGLYENKGIGDNIYFKSYEYNPDNRWITFVTGNGGRFNRKGCKDIGELYIEFPELMLI